MLPEKILTVDLLDILFENRNKDYGAYNLRRTYPARLRLSLGVVSLIAVIFASVVLFRSGDEAMPNPFEKLTGPVVELINPNIDIPKPQPQVAKPAFPKAKQLAHVPPVIVPDHLANNPVPPVDELNKSVISNRTVDGEPTDFTSVIVAPGESTASGSNGNVVSTSEIKPAIFEKAENMPEFPGGKEALIRYLHRNLRQPDDLEIGERKTVLVRFVVTASGTIDDVQLIGSARTDLDNEVLRVVNKMPNWKPGSQNGKQVAVYYLLPVAFVGE